MLTCGSLYLAGLALLALGFGALPLLPFAFCLGARFLFALD